MVLLNIIHNHKSFTVLAQGYTVVSNVSLDQNIPLIYMERNSLLSQ
jgi:hypothetical protein